MRKIALVFFYLLLTLNIYAQEVCKFSVFFSSNSFVLNPEAKSKIDSACKTLSNVHLAYTVKISGHTDNIGNISANEVLSKKRAETTKNYLVQNHFYEKNISYTALADTKPISDNNIEKGRDKNRRVEISISAITPNLNSILKLKTNTASYLLDISKANTCTYSSGSKLIIPANAFETLDGKNVTGTIELKYTEYRNQTDFLFSGIPMSFFDEKAEFKQFNSSGMFKIEASQNGVPLKIKENSAIKINFAKTQNLPELKFFSYDSITKVWTKANQQLSNASQPNAQVFFSNSGGHVVSGRYIKSCVTRMDRKDSCTLYPCTGTLFAIRKGLEFASSKVPIQLSRSHIYFKTIKDPRNRIEWYKLKIEKNSNKFVEFKIIPGLNPSVYDDFIDYSWIYRVSKKALFNKDWENIIWLRVSLSYLSNNDFIITLYSNNEKIILSVTANKKGINSTELISLNEKNRSSNLNLVLEEGEKQQAFDGIFSNRVFSEDTLEMGVFNKVVSDSLTCFYQYSKQWMDKKMGEDTLSFKKWIDFFNKNKEMLKQRYFRLNDQTKNLIAGCREEEKALKELEAKNIRMKFVSDSVNSVNSNKQNQILDNAFQELSIKNLGVWNCDQIERLKEPIYVKRTYSDKNGNKLEPIILYVIDKAVTGTLTYNGYRDLSPYYFPISSKSKNTLIAFDINNNGYLCSADDFSNCIKKDNSSKIILTALDRTNPVEQVNSFIK